MSRFALVCPCQFNAADFMARYEAGDFDFVVAVDGGCACLAHLEVRPDVRLGDFDSLGYVPKDALVHPAIKDASDLELALAYGADQGCDDFVVYGCLGGRIDHELAALQNLAAAAERGARVRAVAGPQAEPGANGRRLRTAMVEVIAGPAQLELACANGAVPEEVPALGAPTYGTVSVFSAGDQALGVSETGMFYPLEHADLTNRSSLGLSNELTSPKGSISLEAGTLYVVYPADFSTALR